MCFNSPQCPKETLEENEAEHEAEREWRCKLLNEWEDEFQETPWQHEGEARLSLEVKISQSIRCSPLWRSEP